MPPSLRPRCLFTSRLYYFCRAHPRVCHLFCSNDRSSHQSNSLRMRLECLEGPDVNTNGSMPATRSLTTRCSVIVTFEWSNIPYWRLVCEIILLHKHSICHIHCHFSLIVRRLFILFVLLLFKKKIILAFGKKYRHRYQMYFSSSILQHIFNGSYQHLAFSC